MLQDLQKFLFINKINGNCYTLLLQIGISPRSLLDDFHKINAQYSLFMLIYFIKSYLTHTGKSQSLSLTVYKLIAVFQNIEIVICQQIHFPVLPILEKQGKVYSGPGVTNQLL